MAIAIIALAVPGLALPAPAGADVGSTVEWTRDTDLVLSGSGITLQILANSTASSLNVTTTSFTVSVPAGGIFTVIWAGSTPGYLINDGSLAPCSYGSGGNYLYIVGPKVVTVTPATTPICYPAAGGGGGGGAVPSMVLNSPNGGQTYGAGDTVTVGWTASGFGLVTIKLWLSLDNGSSWTLIKSGEANDGQYLWTIPNASSTQALIKADVMGETGSILANDRSDVVFTITPYPEGVIPPAGTTADPFVDPNVTGDYSVASALASTSSINSDKNIPTAPAGTPVYCTSGTLIKSPQNTAVYYCGADGKRYVFPNDKVYYSWYADFSGILVISAEDLAMIPLGGLITYKPGAKMIKIQSDPKVYAIARGGLLRWVMTEAIAVKLYGANWNKMIDDVSDAFFFSYTLGDPITEADVGL